MSESSGDVYELRRGNLRALIEQWGGPKPLSQKLDYNNASFLVQMAGPHPTREITEKTARRIESKLDLPPGWMDKTPGPTETGHVDNELVYAAIRLTAAVAEDLGLRLTPTKLADVITLVYADAEAAGAVRELYVRQLLQLMK